MKQTQQQSPTLPSNELAKELIQQIHFSKPENKFTTSQLLLILKNKKNPCHDKFATYIEKQLTVAQIELKKMVEDIKYLGLKMNEVGNTEPQIKSIVSGYRKHFLKIIPKQSKDKRQFTIHLIKDYFQFSSSFCFMIAELVSVATEKISDKNRQFCEKQLHERIVDVVKHRNMSSTESEKCCAIIHHMNLYGYFKIQDLVHIVRSNHQNNISYFFKNKSGVIQNDVLQSYILKQMTINESKVKKLIENLKVDPFQYKGLIKKLNKKCLNYLLKSQPIYATDDKIKNRPDVAQCLVEILLDQNRMKQALHIINKHYLSQFYHLNPTEDRSFNKNALIIFDKFMPTEMMLAKNVPSYGSAQYLTLSELGFGQSMVKFITKDTVALQNLQTISNSPQFGIDCQNSPVYNQYQKSTTQIVQIAVDYKSYDLETEKQMKIKGIFIIDMVGMSENEVFRHWLKKLCQQYKGNIVGHTVKKDFEALVKQVLRQQQVNTNKLNFIDVAIKFKYKFNDTKSNLQYICKSVLGKNLSKFQQCSGWSNRPLRKAQLHYAALDAVLPLVINAKL